MSTQSGKNSDSDPRPPMSIDGFNKNNEKKYPSLYGKPLQNQENFDKINKLLQRAETKMFSKETNFGHLQMKKQIELYEAVITELGLDLQKQDLMPYATMLTKIFQGFRLLYKKAQNLPIRQSSQQFESEKSFLKQQQMLSQSQCGLPQINNNININNNQSSINFQQQQQYQQQQIQQQQQQTQNQNMQINLEEQSFQNEIFQTPQNNNSGLSSAQNVRNIQQQQLNQQNFNQTDGFTRKGVQNNNITNTNQKKQYLFSDQVSQSNLRLNTLTQGTMASTYNSNFPNFNQQNKNTVFEGSMGGVLLEQENQTAFTEIIYDQNIVTFKHSTQTHQEKEQSKKSNKYKNSKQLFRRKNYDDRPKLLAHKGTDTGEDFQNALKDWDQPQKLHQLRSIMEESEENIKELTKQLENQHKIVDKEYSKVDIPIGELAKSLRDRQFDTAQFFAKQNFEEQETPRDNLDYIKELLQQQFKGVQRETALKVFDYINMMLRDRDQRKLLMSPTNQGDKTSTNKGKKGHKGFDNQKGGKIEDLQKKIKEAEKQYQDIQNTLENRDFEMINLQSQLNEKDKNLSKLKTDLGMTEALYVKKERLGQELLQENNNIKKMQKELQTKNVNFEKQIKETEKSLKEERQKLFQYESENKKLNLQLNIIKEQTSKMTMAEQAQISKLCDQILSSDLTEEQKQQCLQQISDFYNGKNLSDKDKQDFKENMLNQIKYSRTNSRRNSNYSRDEGGYTSQRSQYYNKNGRDQDYNDNDYDSDQSDQKVDLNNVKKVQYQEVEVVETLEDGTKVVKKQKILDQKHDIGTVLKDENGKAIKVKGYEKKKVVQKVKQKVTKTRKVINDDGEEVDEEYESEEEIEKEVEIEVPIYEDYVPTSKSLKKQKSQKQKQGNNNNNQKQIQRKLTEQQSKQGSTHEKSKNQKQNNNNSQQNSNFASQQSNNQYNKSNSNTNTNKNQNQSQKQNQNQNLSQQSQQKPNQNQNQIMIEKEIEEEIEEEQIDQHGNKVIVKKTVKKKVKVPLNLDKKKIDPSKIKRTESGTEYLEESDLKNQNLNQQNNNINNNQQGDSQIAITKGKAKQKVKVKTQKRNSKGEVYEVEEEVEKDVEGDIIQIGDSNKKYLKSIKKEKVKKIRKNSKGEDEEYFEEVQKEVFFEVDQDGNILQEMNEEDTKILNDQIQKSQNVSPQKSPKKTIQVKKKVKKERKNSKGQIETYYEDVIVNQEVDENEIPKKNLNGNQKFKTKIVKEKIKKQRKNSKGETVEYFEEVEREVLTPDNQPEIIDKNNEEYKQKKQKEYEEKKKNNQLKKIPSLIKKTSDGKQIVTQKKIVKKQRKNSKGQIEDYEEEEEIQFEIQDGQTMDEFGNIIDSKTGRLVRSQSDIEEEITKQKDENIQVKSNVECDNINTQTDLSLLWPIIQNILLELGIDIDQIKNIYQKYFTQNSDPTLIAELLTPGPDLKTIEDKIKQQKYLYSQQQQQEQNQQDSQKKVQIKGNTQNKSQQNTVQVEEKYIDPKTDQLLRLFENLNDDEREQEENELFNNRNLKVLEDKALLLEPTIKKIYLQLRQAKDKHVLEVRRKIRQYYGKEGDGYVSYEEFKNYYLKMMAVHNRCGDGCIHLAKFFAKIGFTANKFNRRKELKPKKQKPIPFSENQPQKQSLF